MSATTPEPTLSAVSDEGRAREIRERHARVPGLRARLRDADPERARQAYLEEQLALTERLAAVMAVATDADLLATEVVRELQATLGTYFAAIVRVEGERLRTIAAHGPLAEDLGRFIVTEFPVSHGVCGRVVRSGQTELIPDSVADPDYIHRNLATDPRSQLAVPIRVDGRVWGVLNLEEAEPGAFDEIEATLIRIVANQLGVALHRIGIYQELERALVTTLTVLGAAMEVRDAYTALHEAAVAELAVAIASELGLDPGEQRDIRYAALTHDLGKLSVPNEILHKPGPLDEAEWAIMRGHTIVGADMLARIPFFEGVVALVRGHHERWDGDGYPDGLRAQEIPVGARILCACDSYNAMTTNRPYRAALSVGAALEEMRRCTGSQFDPEVVAALERVLAQQSGARG